MKINWRATTGPQSEFMRNAFSKFLYDSLKKKHEIYLISGDLGFAAFDELREEFPDSFINSGVAEQSMISIGTGMALEGKEVYCYSILPFAAYRPFEQIRIACYNKAPIRVVGMGVGIDYDLAGNTHFGLEDIQVITSLPNITVLSPCDEKEVEILLSQISGIKNPVYLRLSKSSDNSVHSMHDRIRLGEPLKVRGDDDKQAEIAIVSTGVMTKTAMEVADRLDASGRECDVWHIHTVKPCNYGSMVNSLKKAKTVVTIEENTGGFTQIVSSWMSTSGASAKVVPFTLPDDFGHTVGKKKWMLEQMGLSPERIYDKLLKQL